MLKHLKIKVETIKRIINWCLCVEMYNDKLLENIKPFGLRLKI